MTVKGSEKHELSQEGGALALFKVLPGDEISVTFENIPGYLAKPPTGKATFPG